MPYVCLYKSVILSIATSSAGALSIFITIALSAALFNIPSASNVSVILTGANTVSPTLIAVAPLFTYTTFLTSLSFAIISFAICTAVALTSSDKSATSVSAVISPIGSCI